MWIEKLKEFDAASQVVIWELQALRLRLAKTPMASDEAVLLLWSRQTRPAQFSEALTTAQIYLEGRYSEMRTRLQNIDMFHLMISVYAVGDFGVYLREVHGFPIAVANDPHPLPVAVTSLALKKTEIAALYSPDYDTSDAAIQAELAQQNPWR